MRKHTTMLLSLLVGLGVSVGAYAAGTDMQKCGSTQGKALATAVSAIFKESARACGKTETGGPDGAVTVKHSTSARTAGSFDAKVGSSVDKYNLDVDADLDFDDMGDEDNCPFDIGVLDSPFVAGFSQAFADAACSPTG